jgi:hypothetical protein
MSNCFEKFFKLVAQAFQPVSRKQVSRAHPGKAVPPKHFYGFWLSGRLMFNCLETRNKVIQYVYYYPYPLIDP